MTEEYENYDAMQEIARRLVEQLDREEPAEPAQPSDDDEQDEPRGDRPREGR